ncbi:MAG TPA: hypothetical protein VKR55_02310 [Bradyrhizobium sp.]|nr:hypothetical protein [Bradyrhizobium sp.]HLZ00967.1 hypothetical protein [Bradyrhizobium sp.]
MIWIGLAIFALLVVTRLSLPFIRSPARETIGVANVPFDGS